MKELLTRMMGTRVRVELTNETQLSGRLVSLQTDYAAVLDAREQFAYFPYRHIKSVTTNHTELPDLESVAIPSAANDFKELLQSLMKKMVNIESGREARQGVLIQIAANEISLVLDMEQMIHYATDQIRSISAVQKAPLVTGVQDTNTANLTGDTASPSSTTSTNERVDDKKTQSTQKQVSASYVPKSLPGFTDESDTEPYHTLHPVRSSVKPWRTSRLRRAPNKSSNMRAISRSRGARSSRLDSSHRLIILRGNLQSLTAHRMLGRTLQNTPSIEQIRAACCGSTITLRKKTAVVTSHFRRPHMNHRTMGTKSIPFSLAK